MPPSFIRRDVELAPLTTLGVGGPAARFAGVRTEQEVVEALRWAAGAQQSVVVLGGGSNVVVADSGLRALVLQLLLREVTVQKDGRDVLVTAGAGVEWDALVTQCVREGWAGVECLAGIPGFVGAAPIQNIGAYGQQVGGVVKRVRVWDRRAGRVADLSASECGFGYRTSTFKRDSSQQRIVLDVTLRLRPGAAATVRYAELARSTIADSSLAAVRAKVLALRRAKSMVINPADPNSRSVGSFFVNPILDAAAVAVVEQKIARAGIDPLAMPRWESAKGQIKLAAAWLIERAGLVKGYRLGQAGLSTRHTLAVVNLGTARAIDVVELAAHVRDTVRRRFGVFLVPEPVFLGFSWPTLKLLDETSRLGGMPGSSC